MSGADRAASGALDSLSEHIDSGRGQLAGVGLVLELIKAVLERGLQAQMTRHQRYENGDPAASRVT